MQYDIFWICQRVVENARAVRIEVHPMPREVYSNAPPPPSFQQGIVYGFTPRGHYFFIDRYVAYFIAVDDYRPSVDYRDMVLGFELESISELLYVRNNLDSRLDNKKFTRVAYKALVGPNG